MMFGRWGVLNAFSVYNIFSLPCHKLRSICSVCFFEVKRELRVITFHEGSLAWPLAAQPCSGHWGRTQPLFIATLINRGQEPPPFRGPSHGWKPNNFIVEHLSISRRLLGEMLVDRIWRLAVRNLFLPAGDGGSPPGDSDPMAGAFATSCFFPQHLPGVFLRWWQGFCLPKMDPQNCPEIIHSCHLKRDPSQPGSVGLHLASGSSLLQRALFIYSLPFCYFHCLGKKKKTASHPYPSHHTSKNIWLCLNSHSLELKFILRKAFNTLVLGGEGGCTR